MSHCHGKPCRVTIILRRRWGGGGGVGSLEGMRAYMLAHLYFPC